MFGNVQKNLKSSLDWGWCPLNHILLNHPEIRLAITTEELECEKNSHAHLQGFNNGNSELAQEDVPNAFKAFLPESQTD